MLSGGKKLFVLVAFFVLLPSLSSACRPKGPDPWFVSQLTFDRPNLPAGVEIIETGNQYYPYAIRNFGDEPLYLVKNESTYSDEYPVFTDSATNEEYIAVVKLQNGKLFLYNPGNVANRPTGWLEDIDTNNNPIGDASIDNYNIIISEDFIAENTEDYQYSSKRGDNRPA